MDKYAFRMVYVCFMYGLSHYAVNKIRKHYLQKLLNISLNCPV